jgi:beta-fructofuranosidase
MHAISNDGFKWEKVEKDTFEPSEQYEPNDFRDPYIIWNENEECYWILIKLELWLNTRL